MYRSVPYTCSSSTGDLGQRFPIAMGYVPWQVWSQTYPLDSALANGTIFPELDLRFDHGRCSV